MTVGPDGAGEVIRIVVLDDHLIVRHGLRHLLGSQPDMAVVGEAGDGREGLVEVARHRPDVVLMDLRMPVLDGVETLEVLSRTHPDVAALVLTTFEDVEGLQRAVRAGAVGFLLKDVPREELFRAVRAAAHGRPIEPSLTGRRPARPADAPSPRELEVLALVAKGLTNRSIARALALSEATVKTHLVHVFAKMGVRDRTSAVTAALERGLLRLGPRE